MITTIPQMSTEWLVSFDWSTASFPSGWMSIIHFTMGEDNGKYGDRLPAEDHYQIYFILQVQ